MQIKLGTHVWTRDDQDIGRVDQLVLDPTSNTVKAAVIRQGHLLPRDVEVPVTALAPDAAGHLRLAYTADQLDTLPEFVASSYTSVPPISYVAPPGLLWPVDYGMLLATDEAWMAPTQQDLANALIAEGSDIVSRDGKTVGQLGQLTFDPTSGRLTRFVIRTGLIFTRALELPAALITRSDDRVLTLRVDAATFDAWLQLSDGLEVWTSDGVLLGRLTRQMTGALEVVAPDRTHWLRVPLTAVARVADGQVRLAADATQAAQWQTPPSQETPMEQTVPLL